MPGQPPSYMLVANEPSPVAGAPDVKSDEATKIQIAKLKAQSDEHEQTAKKAMAENEELKAKLQAANIFNQGNGINNVNTIAMTEDEMKQVGMSEDQIKTAMTQHEPATKVQEAKIAKLTAMVVKPYIQQILTARRNAGESEASLKTQEARLVAMNFEALENEYKQNQVFINSPASDAGLFARKEEESFGFNGVSSHPLVGKTFSLDQINEVTA